MTCSGKAKPCFHRQYDMVAGVDGASTDVKQGTAGVFIKGPRLIVIANRIAANLNR